MGVDLISKECCLSSCVRVTNTKTGDLKVFDFVMITTGILSNGKNMPYIQSPPISNNASQIMRNCSATLLVVFYFKADQVLLVFYCSALQSNVQEIITTTMWVGGWLVGLWEVGGRLVGLFGWLWR